MSPPTCWHPPNGARLTKPPSSIASGRPCPMPGRRSACSWPCTPPAPPTGRSPITRCRPPTSRPAGSCCGRWPATPSAARSNTTSASPSPSRTAIGWRSSPPTRPAPRSTNGSSRPGRSSSTSHPSSGTAEAGGAAPTYRPVKLGVFLLAGQFPGMTEGQALAGAADAAVTAERAGLDSVWIAEHHFITYGVCPSAVAFAANVLGRTSRITIGTAVCMLSNRHPVALAEETALLDHLSGGRFALGVGRGGPWVDLEVFGTGLARFEDGFPDSLDLLLAGLEQGRVAADDERSRFFRFRPVPLVPRPATEPRPPVVVAATTLPTVEAAAARGLPLLLGMHATDEDKRDLLTHYAKVAAEHGHHPDAVEHIGTAICHIAGSRAEAEAELRAAMPEWIRRGVGGYVPLSPGLRPARDPQAYVEHLLANPPAGTPAACVARLRASAQATGIGTVLLMVEGTGDPGRTRETVLRLGAEVAPMLKAAQ